MSEEKFGRPPLGCNITLQLSAALIAVIIVDSIMALFRVDFSGRGELADRQQKLNKMLSSMIKMAEQYNIAVVLTNQVMYVPA